jgi:hypothetical protein
MSKRIVTVAVAAVVLAAGIGGYAVFVAAKPPADVQDTFVKVASVKDGSVRDTPAEDATSRELAWMQGDWPFPIDQWGKGWVYQCKAVDCGADVTLYVRPKIGFCNCQTGVADDEELDRVSDTDLIGGERSALSPGRPIKVRWMKGRSRSYTVSAPAGKSQPAKSVLSLAFNNSCDVIVATVVAGKKPAAQEEAVLEFLNTERMLDWIVVVLGI